MALLRNVVALLSLLLCAISVANAGKPEGIQVTDVNGKTVRPLESRGQKATVLFFIIHDCPIANRYAPEISRIQAKYAPKKVAFFLVYADPGLKAVEAKRHAQEYGYTFPALLDPMHRLAKKAGATLSPEAAIFDAKGKRVYLGRIDDRYIDFGKSREEPETRDARRALDALLQGKPVPRSHTKAIGCFLPEVK